MQGLVTEFGARFIAGYPHPPANLEAFGQAALRSAPVRNALRGSGRHRLLEVIPVEAYDEAEDRFYARECEAVIYDYARNHTLRARGVPGLTPRVLVDRTQPVPSGEEFQDAVSLVAASPLWGPLLQSGYVRAYMTMPPVLEPVGDEAVERTVYVGLYSRPRRFNRVVAVNMVRREVRPQETVPRGARILGGLCGPDPAICSHNIRGTQGTATIEWPAKDPVWRFQVTRPTASSGTNGSGVDIKGVRFRGRSVLRQAHVPLLNVQYEGDVCGPFRDWLWDEVCFNAPGSDIPGAPGIRWCTAPPQTIVDTGQDGGTFKGVAVFEDLNAGTLTLLSVCSAGWYRYISGFRFYLDGRIHPFFQFGTVANTCVCNAHNHHAYWRLDFDILKGRNVCEEFVGGAWLPIKKETTRTREVGTELQWRVRHEKKDVGYEIIPGPDDGVGDAFSGPDQYVLRRREGEIDDGHQLIGPPGNQQVDLLKFVQAKEGVYRQNLVVWYSAHFLHTQDESEALHGEDTELGPLLQPFNWPTS